MSGKQAQGDCDGEAWFDQRRCRRVDDAFVSQIVHRWLCSANRRMAAGGRREAEKATADESLLTVLQHRRDQIDRVVNETFPYLGKVRLNLGSNRAGYNAGKVAANAAQITPQGRISA